jgi:hypothetical protein
MTTVFVSLTDQGYYPKALRTLEELRRREAGNWQGDIVLICVDFDPNEEQMKKLNIITRRVQHIDHLPLWNTWKNFPIPPMADNRHYAKVTQWDKLEVFSDYFKSWDRVVFLDAGIRVLDSVEHLLALPWEGRFLAPDDSDPYDNGNRFKCQVKLEANPKAKEDFEKEFGTDILNKRYFLNCIFLFDTRLLNARDAYTTMKSWMYKYPIMACNEMGVLNLYFRDLWVPFPQKIFDNSKYLFGWSELNYRERPNWQKFCFLKYASTI